MIWPSTSKEGEPPKPPRTAATQPRGHQKQHQSVRPGRGISPSSRLEGS